MSGCVVCLSGYIGDDTERLQRLIERMGGTVEKSISDNTAITHLLAFHCTSLKYYYAVDHNIPVLDEAWVHQCWEKRRLLDIEQFRRKPFHGCLVATATVDEREF
jgi:NAD-dependent DNA ligase